MRRIRDGRLTTALAFLIGVLVATAGTATAAKLITGKQIKDGSISAKDLSKAVRSQLAKAGVPGPQGAQGLQGVTGSPGPKGDKGDSGATNAVTRRVSAEAAPAAVKAVQVSCEPGETVTGGGASDDLGSAGVYVIRNAPVPGNQVKSTGWQVSYHNTTGVSHTVWAYVLCSRP